MTKTTETNPHTRQALAAVKTDEWLRELNQALQAEQATLEERLSSLIKGIQSGDGEAASQAHHDLYCAVKRMKVACATAALMLYKQRPTFRAY